MKCFCCNANLLSFRQRERCTNLTLELWLHSYASEQYLSSTRRPRQICFVSLQIWTNQYMAVKNYRLYTSSLLHFCSASVILSAVHGEQLMCKSKTSRKFDSREKRNTKSNIIGGRERENWKIQRVISVIYIYIVTDTSRTIFSIIL